MDHHNTADTQCFTLNQHKFSTDYHADLQFISNLPFCVGITKFNLQLNKDFFKRKKTNIKKTLEFAINFQKDTQHLGSGYFFWQQLCHFIVECLEGYHFDCKYTKRYYFFPFKSTKGYFFCFQNWYPQK